MAEQNSNRVLSDSSVLFSTTYISEENKCGNRYDYFLLASAISGFFCLFYFVIVLFFTTTTAMGSSVFTEYIFLKISQNQRSGMQEYIQSSYGSQGRSSSMNAKPKHDVLGEPAPINIHFPPSDLFLSPKHLFPFLHLTRHDLFKDCVTFFLRTFLLTHVNCTFQCAGKS